MSVIVKAFVLALVAMVALLAVAEAYIPSLEEMSVMKTEAEKKSLSGGSDE